MDAQVIPLPVKKKRRYEDVSQGAEFYCLKCSGDTFKLWESGDISCVGCGAHMSNIWVRTMPEAS